MKTRFGIIVLSVGFLNDNAAVTAEAKGMKPIEKQVKKVAAEAKGMKPIEKQVKKEGLVLTAILPEKCLAGEQIDLTISIENQRKDDVVYYDNVPARDFNLMMRDSKMKPVPLTEFGKIMLPPLADREKFRNIRRILSFGKDVKVRINLSRLFDLTKVGSYNLHLERQFILNQRKPNQELLKLELKVSFEVSEPPPE